MLLVTEYINNRMYNCHWESWLLLSRIQPNVEQSSDCSVCSKH